MTTTPYIRKELLPSYTYKVRTPDGTMWCTICEDNGEPVEIHIMIGKTGTMVRAWTSALGSTISLALRSGISIAHIIHEISGITTAKIQANEKGVKIRSGPEGVAYALLRYLQEKKRESGYADSEDTMELGGFSEG